MSTESQDSIEPQGSEQEETTPAPPAPETPTTPDGESQDSTDWKAEARKWENRAKKDAQSLQSIKDALTEKDSKVSAAEANALAAQINATRYRIAYEAGLPPELASRLTGDTEEAITADAKALAALVKAGKSANTAATDGSGTPPPPPSKPDANKLLRSLSHR